MAIAEQSRIARFMSPEAKPHYGIGSRLSATNVSPEVKLGDLVQPRTYNRSDRGGSPPPNERA
jgi:hypothetical protein